MSWEAELAFAHELADAADEITLRHFRHVRARRKDDGTLLTEADERTEQTLRAAIAARYPRDAILGEEQGATGTAPRRWIIDPIDGTSNYAWGIPVWATLIALEVEGEITVGVVSAPALDERYDAARGAGARRNGEAIHVSDVDALSEARVGFTYTTLGEFADGKAWEPFLELVTAARHNRGFGDFWGHCLVAAGALDIMVEPAAHPWDFAPLVVITEEAGGRFTDLAGHRRIDGGSGLTTNGRLHEAALAKLRS